MKNKRIAIVIIALAIAVGGIFLVLAENNNESQIVAEQLAFGQTGHAKQTAVDQMEIVFSPEGVMQHRSPEHGLIVLPGWLAFHSLDLLSKDEMTPEEKLQYYGCLNWLKDNLREKAPGLWVWDYPIDNTYNDITSTAPWDSAFAQGVGISLFIKAWEREKDDTYLEAAEKAASGLFIAVEHGGLAFIKGDDIWFEEVPTPQSNPTHILNAHMSCLVALKQLEQATGKAQYGELFSRGLATLKRWLPLFDTGYALRYDLNPQKTELLFKIANPYGFATYPLAVEKISIKDPLSGNERSINVGSENAFEGDVRISGIHWAQAEEVAGRKVRRLVSVPAGEASHAYFYLKLPSEWTDNLRTQEFEIYITYYDEAPANLNVQKRAMAPGPEYRDMKYGDLLLSGSGQWREWMVPLAPTDLGWWVGEDYNKCNGQWLRQLGNYDEALLQWARVADGYHGAGVKTDTANLQVVDATIEPLPQNTPMLNRYKIGDDGILRQYQSVPNSDAGKLVNSPFAVAQILLEKDTWTNFENKDDNFYLLTDKAAISWFLDSANYITLANGGIAHLYDFDNVYNDVQTKQPWVSAFAQAFVAKALAQAYIKGIRTDEVLNLYKQVVKAYEIDVKDGGLISSDRTGLPFFEEVPNATHVLNAHLYTIQHLLESDQLMNLAEGEKIVKQGIESLKSHWAYYDTGYWLKYDQNPRKNFLMKLEWHGQSNSPPIDTVWLEDPQTGVATAIYVGDSKDNEGNNRLAGNGWSASFALDQTMTRNIKPSHEAYIWLTLPDSAVANYFDIPNYKFIIRYRDNASGVLICKIQSISSENELKFIPLRHGALSMQGDGKWKIASCYIRPQDLGWNKGAVYQKFEVEALGKINDILHEKWIEQEIERHNYFEQANSKELLIVQENILPWGVDNKPQMLALLEDIAPKSRVVASSPHYDDYGIENILDGDPYNNYAAMEEGEDPQGFILDLGRKALVHEIMLVFENNENYPADFTLDSTSYANDIIRGTNFGRLLVVKDHLRSAVINHTGETWSQKFNPPLYASYLKFLATRFNGQNRLLLRQIRIMAEPPTGLQQALLAEEGAKVLIAENDESNPLQVFRIPITQGVKDYSGILLQDDESSTSHQKIVTIMRAFDNHMTATTQSGAPREVLLHEIGACGSWVNAMAAMLKAQGMESRIIGLYNAIPNDGHVVLEVNINGKWCLYDPTYGLYYTTEPENSVDPYVLSYEELRQGGASKPGVVRVVGNEKRLASAGAFADPAIFTQANPAGLIGHDKPMVFPLTLEAGAELNSDKFSTANQGSPYIGAAYINANQQWTLTGLTPGKNYSFIITPADIVDMKTPSSQKPSFILHADLRGTQQDTILEYTFVKADNMDPWSINFTAKTDTATLTLTHPYLGPQNRYLSVQQYKLSASVVDETLDNKTKQK